MARIGRPPHKPSRESRRKVSIAAGAGMHHEDIAAALGITQPTLRKHYADELSRQAHLRRIEVLGALYAAAMKGSVSAQKAYSSASPQAAAPDPDPPEVSEKAQGKKAAANSEAKSAHVGTGWEELLHSPSAIVQ